MDKSLFQISFHELMRIKWSIIIARWQVIDSPTLYQHHSQ